ncbi:UV DNA damage repair endonuclease UvsE [Caldalkalibacillus mannanilyticus]|uniref:UV DNA damage repair endonuclease UvsE n=1 Tax=Caldalkalibacillus mannanilyticus TaxID=1418 RepID=UPI00046AB4E7|nr:UV DNA damage repair endonuclease UvsE [Caldalkalibacillus mannanilyticus]
MTQTIVRLGYVAMSVNLKNCSPSQTMTYAQFTKMDDREAVIRKLEQIAISNVQNCLRLLKHNKGHDVRFFRLSSRLVPLATHDALAGWDYLTPMIESLRELGKFAMENDMRIDFHPDHFVLLNSPKPEIFKQSLLVLKLHHQLLRAMGIDLQHRCVMHVGGNYKDTEASLERFVTNWADVPTGIQKMIMLENDDKSFTLLDTLYLCEKLGIPLVFDYHHHLAHHKEKNWESEWERVIDTWKHSPLPPKMHISSPKNEKEFRHHADYIDLQMFLDFLQQIKGSLPEIHCMIEAKQKDQALFQLMEEIKKRKDIQLIDQATFLLL